MDYSVRELSAKDLEPKRGFFATLSNLTEAPPLSPAKAKKTFSAMKKQGSIIFVAAQPDGTIVGTATLLLEQKFIREGAVCGHVEDVATRKGHEGKGIASAILRAIMVRAKKERCYKIILDCATEHALFYEKFGFTKNELCMRFPAKRRK